MAVVGLALVLATQPGHAQVKASTVPISRDTLTLRVVFAQSPLRLTVQNGGLARLAIKNGAIIGLVPVITSHGANLTVFEIVADPVTGNEGMKQVVKVDLVAGRVVRIAEAALPLEVELVQTTPAAKAPPGIDGPCLTCCVTCGEIISCACLVEAECGSCCCPAGCVCLKTEGITGCTAAGATPVGAKPAK